MTIIILSITVTTTMIICLAYSCYKVGHFSGKVHADYSYLQRCIACTPDKIETISTEEDMVEKLAPLEHEQWKVWMQNMRQYLTQEGIDKYNKYMVNYEDLSDHEKEWDREWARKVIEVLENKN